MPAKILETGRSYMNPVDSEDYTKVYTGTNVPAGYTITFQGVGPGGYKFGKDQVFYLGEPTETCLDNCNAERVAVYRYYSGKLRDHLYSRDEVVQEGQEEFRSYNREPRQRNSQYFSLMKDSQTGTVAVYSNYDSANNDSYLTTGSGTTLLGYIWTSASNAASSGLMKGGEVAVPLYEYKLPNGVNRGPDTFYTINPVEEVNLETGVAGVPDCLDARQGQYAYVGIFGYIMTSSGPRGKKKIENLGGARNTGEISRAGWYDWDEAGNYALRDYLESMDNPSQSGWGGSNVEILSTAAYYEWFYGKNGPVKGSVPKSLNFHDAFEGQFVYYLYDTSYPWNGPVYGINFLTTNAPCLQDSNSQPTYEYHTFNYTIKESAWVTHKTRVYVDAPAHQPGANESFWGTGTDEHRIFFRYTSNTGFFAVGERINNWMISACRYFGDEMNCGYMELTQINNETTGSTFTYNQSFTSTNGGSINVLAGYGIKDKAAFWGVYEFPKRVSYVPVALKKGALIPERNLNEAFIEAIIDEKGKVAGVNIINSGKDYKDPDLGVEFPETMREQGFADPTKFRQETFKNDTGIDLQAKEIEDPDFKDGEQSEKDATAVIMNNAYKNESGFVGTLKQAQLRAVLDDQGSIINVIIEDPGAGYSPSSQPKVLVIQRYEENLEEPGTDGGIEGLNTQYDASLKTGVLDPDMQEQVNNNLSNFSDTIADYDVPRREGTVTAYIDMPDINPEEMSKDCESTPQNCINLEIPGGWSDINAFYDTDSTFANLRQYAPEFNERNTEISQMWALSNETSKEVDADTAGINSLYPSGCEEWAQPNMYHVRRFFDIPCPYETLDADGEKSVFGFMPFKYCASQEETANIRVSMEIEGDVSGAGASVNTSFMNFLKSLPAPTLTRPRSIANLPNGIKAHPCKQGEAEGRCYRTSAGQYAFVPLSGDENTFDYGLSGMTELGQLQTWIGNNVSGYGGSTNFTYGYNTAAIAACSGGKLPNPCWHNFVTDGILDVNKGYDGSGNALSQDDLCSSSPLQACSGTNGSALYQVVHAAISIDPNLVNADNYIEMGPFEGTLLYRNYSAASTKLLEDTMNNYGNPYFDECDLRFD